MSALQRQSMESQPAETFLPPLTSGKDFVAKVRVSFAYAIAGYGDGKGVTE
jgi:hypothetical protein